jgi:tetratricopeptide (TPR) repeat protein
VATDRHIWIESYERDVRDVLTLQNEVAQTIARAVQIQLTPQEQAGFAVAASARQVNPAAQDAYLQGRYYWNKRTPEGLQQALDYFRQAAGLDPLFAAAHAGEADAYNLLPGHMAPAVAYPLAKTAATRALSLDPTLAEAHASLAFATFIFDHDWPGAEEGFQRALQHNPGYATAHHWYDEAFAQFDQASAIDPLSPAIPVSIGSTLLFDGRYDEAISRLRASLANNPDTPGAYYYLAVCYELKGMLAEAATETRHGLDIAPRHEFLLSESGRLAALGGRRADAVKVAADLAARPSGGSIPVTIAYVYAALGDTDRVFGALNRAQTERSPSLLWLRSDPMFASLRGDPRFSEVLRQVGLPH